MVRQRDDAGFELEGDGRADSRRERLGRVASRRRRPAFGLLRSVALVLLGALVMAGCSGPPREDIGPLVREYAEAWSDRDAAALGELTDAPRVARREVDRYQRAIGTWETAVRPVGDPSCGLGGCQQTLRVVHQVPGVGPWRYSTTVSLEAADGAWQVHWTPANFHPDLADGGTLRARPGARAERRSATLLTASGEPLAETAQVPELIRRLADRGGAIELVDADGRSETLYRPKRAREEIQLTLDPESQRAAESALVDIGGSGALVAVRASTGEVLAAVGDGALNGRYEPGSVFSVVSAAALIDRGLDTGEEVSCPAEATAGDTAFRNPGGDRRPDGPFWEAFAWSCDTTIVGRSGSLRTGDLAAAAEQFGIGAAWDLGVPAHSGKLPGEASKPESAPARIAATAIGRDGVTVSPLAMAGVAGTVAAGGPTAPTVVVDDESAAGRAADYADDQRSRPNAGPRSDRAPGEGVLTRIRGLMRAGVTDGPAAPLEEPDHELYASVGRTLDQKHEWIIGFREDLAFAVMVSRDAVGVANRFLDRHP